MFRFNFGKSNNKKNLIIVSIVLSSIVATLSQCSRISENNLWDLLDEIQRKYFPQTIINEVIRQDPDKIGRRINRDVGKAIHDYQRLTGDDGTVKISSPRYIEKSINESLCYSEECKSLGGEMRLCAPWVDTCIKE